MKTKLACENINLDGKLNNFVGLAYYDSADKQ